MLCFSHCEQMLSLALKTPRKPASENVVCLCRLLNTLENFSNLFLHIGKQCGPRSDRSSLIWVHTVCKNDLKSQADDKADDNCCGIRVELAEKRQNNSERVTSPENVSLPFNYSRTSLSRTRLFRITAYLEVKIWSLF